MSSDKNKKKKKSKSKKINFKIIFLVILGLAFLTILGFIIDNSINKNQYYGCTEYYMISSGDTEEVDYLDGYDYYRLYFNDSNDTFYLEYKVTNGTSIIKEEGTYTIKSRTVNGEVTDVLILSYDSFADEITGDPEYYLTDKNTWTRSQKVTLSDTISFEVHQTFQKGKN